MPVTSVAIPPPATCHTPPRLRGYRHAGSWSGPGGGPDVPRAREYSGFAC